jgi:hypothetical protein
MKELRTVRQPVIIACWPMLCTGELYNALGGDYRRQRDPERTAN